MTKLGRKIAISIIIAGLFIVVSIIAINYQSLIVASYGVIAALIVFILLFGLAMGQNFTSPLGEILKAAYNVAKGESKKIDLRNNTKDEVNDLAKVFNKIAQDFQRIKEELEMVKKSLDIKFKTKDLLSQQVISALEEKIKNRTADLERATTELNDLKRQVMIKDEQIYNLNMMVETKKRKSKS